MAKDKQTENVTWDHDVWADVDEVPAETISNQEPPPTVVQPPPAKPQAIRTVLPEAAAETYPSSKPKAAIPKPSRPPPAVTSVKITPASSLDANNRPANVPTVTPGDPQRQPLSLPSAWKIGLGLGLLLGMAAAGWIVFGGSRHGETKPPAPTSRSVAAETASSQPPVAVPTPHRVLDPSAPVSDAAWNQLLRGIQGPLLDEPITFDPGEKELSEDARRVILEGAQKLSNYSPHIRLLVEVHVDKGTSPPDDQKLSEERAQAVKQFLTAECRISPDRIFLRPCGSDQPPDWKAGESERAYQRRARSVGILLANE